MIKQPLNGIITSCLSDVPHSFDGHDLLVFDFLSSPILHKKENVVVVILKKDLITLFRNVIPFPFPDSYCNSFIFNSLIVDNNIEPHYFILNMLETYFEFLDAKQRRYLKDILKTFVSISFVDHSLLSLKK